MKKTNAIVSRYVRMTGATTDSAGLAAATRGGAFELEGGRRIALSPDNPRSEGFARVLAGLAELHHPVYLELDPETETVARLLVPVVGRIRSVREVGGGLEVELDNSHARHLLARDREDFADNAEILREAEARDRPVILTPDDTQRVEDISFFEPGPDDGPFPKLPPHRPPDSVDFIGRLFRWRWWPWRWWYFRCLSATRAQQIFNAMSATTCNPAGIAPPCIPFMYPDDGCWGRAHEMRRLMANMGVNCRKVWIFGTLHTPTRNNPNCSVNWGWHVAPTICVRRRYWWLPWFWFGGQDMVIDPSLFTTPVTKAQWKAVQGDPNATLNDTDGSVFHWWNNQTDPNYAQTNQVLATYRLALQNRVNNSGPPPYAHCP